jgi:CBS domain-containing protein
MAMDPSGYQLTAGDLMTIEPIVVAANASIEEAQRLMLEFTVSGLPVVDDSDTLVGVISQTDLLHLDNPDLGRLIRRQASGIKVGEVMSRPPITVLLSTLLADAARTMLEKRVHRVVVIDEKDRPIGVLSALDFVQLYADE